MKVILPVESKVRSTKIGLTYAKTLIPGDSVVAYNYEARKQVFITLHGVEHIGRDSGVSILLRGVAYITLALDTIIVTKTGEMRIADSPKYLIGQCLVNPNQLVTRELSLVLPLPDPEMVILTWDGPEYIIAEGMLVGSSNEK